MHIWGLFDDGNGCYRQAVNEYNVNMGGQHTITSIGIGDACINQDLAVNMLHKPNALWEQLDKLDRPDVILASPPCESWSVASAMKGGNACWKQEQSITTSLFGGYEASSKFTIRNKDDYQKYQFKYDKSFLTRINGEMCIYNTLRIIDRYKPKIFVIENPAYGRIWEYIANVIGFNIPYENLTYYNNYGYKVQKPTKFGSNIDLKLRNKRVKGKISFYNYNNGGNRYNTRSNIPIDLVKHILKACEEHINS
jgi:hypothetical protein